MAFHRPGGPLLALRGLVGGAGTSTLAYAIGRRAARHSSAPILLGELPDGAGLAAVAGTASPLGLGELAAAVDVEREQPPPFLELVGGLRLVASAAPAPEEGSSIAGLERVLADARAAHGLVVIDSGRIADAESRVLLRHASHVLFVLPAQVAALRRAEQLAAAGALDVDCGAFVGLLATRTTPGPRAEVKQLRRLAEQHADRLLLVPHVPELAAGDHHRADGGLENIFAALGTLLRGPR